MKDFDLRAAKRGAAVCTRRGLPVRIICWDMKCKSYGYVNRLVYLTDYNGDEHISSCWLNGSHSVHGSLDADDLVMRDDDYAEKMERGEYGKHAEQALHSRFQNGTTPTWQEQWLDPVVKENLTTDREYWRRVYAGQMMAAAFPVLVSTDWQAKGEYANIPAETLIARQAIDFADALLEELEKTEKKL